jgi:hypothetical protein
MMAPSRALVVHSTVVLACCMVAASPARGEDSLLLAGGEYSDAAYYSYLGLILPGPGRHENGRGFVQRYWLDAFGYEYDGAPGRVNADVAGGEAALGYSVSSGSSWGTISAGARYTNTDLSPDDPSATARGSQWGLKVQVEGETDLAPAWRAGGIASYTFGQDGYWARMRVMRSGAGATAVGGEVIANGNPEAHSTATGLVLAVKPRTGRWSVNLRAGYRFQDEADGAYGGLEFGYGFR